MTNVWANFQQITQLNIQNHFAQKNLLVKMDRQTQVMYNSDDFEQKKCLLCCYYSAYFEPSSNGTNAVARSAASNTEKKGKYLL